MTEKGMDNYSYSYSFLFATLLTEVCSSISPLLSGLCLVPLMEDIVWLQESLLPFSLYFLGFLQAFWDDGTGSSTGSTVDSCYTLFQIILSILAS